MPSTIQSLFSAVGITRYNRIKWGSNFIANGMGVYVVSLSSDDNLNNNLLNTAPVDEGIVKFWIDKVNTITLDGINPPKVEDLTTRLKEFWLPDESILYIGMTGSKLSRRVAQYYSTELGERKPHAGGHWIKTLSNISELFVYYAECNLSGDVEDNLIAEFIRNVSEESKNNLRDSIHPFPFANLEYPKGTRKNHGIEKSKLKD